MKRKKLKPFFSILKECLYDEKICLSVIVFTSKWIKFTFNYFFNFANVHKTNGQNFINQFNC